MRKLLRCFQCAVRVPKARRVMQDYQKHTPTDEEPWWEDMTPAHPHYGRALQLSSFVAAIRRGPSLMMNKRRIAYRQRCIENWQYYLENGESPC